MTHSFWPRSGWAVPGGQGWHGCCPFAENWPRGQMAWYWTLPARSWLIESMSEISSFRILASVASSWIKRSQEIESVDAEDYDWHWIYETLDIRAESRTCSIPGVAIKRRTHKQWMKIEEGAMRQSLQLQYCEACDHAILECVLVELVLIGVEVYVIQRYILWHEIRHHDACSILYVEVWSGIYIYTVGTENSATQNFNFSFLRMSCWSTGRQTFQISSIECRNIEISRYLVLWSAQEML